MEVISPVGLALLSYLAMKASSELPTDDSCTIPRPTSFLCLFDLDTGERLRDLPAKTAVVRVSVVIPDHPSYADDGNPLYLVPFSRTAPQRHRIWRYHNLGKYFASSDMIRIGSLFLMFSVISK